jgi:hypothetical protein
MIFHALPNLIKLFESFYNIPLKHKHIKFVGLVQDLSSFYDCRNIISEPRILSPRLCGEVYHQDKLINILPHVFKKYGSIPVTVHIGHNKQQAQHYFEELIKLADNLLIKDKINFNDRVLSQTQYKKMILDHSIFYSIASGEHGFSTTTAEIATNGGIALVQNTEEIDGIIDDKINIIRTEIEEKQIFENICFAIEHNIDLQKLFKKNNKKLIAYDWKTQSSILTKAYDILANLN